MSYHNNPHIQARIFQARQKKQTQLRQTAHIYYARGASSAAKIAKEIAAEFPNMVYEFDSMIMWKLKLLAPELRILKGSDITIPLDELIVNARKSLDGNTEPHNLIRISVQIGRSEQEVWTVHRGLSGINGEELTPELTQRIASEIARRFPA